MQVQTSIKLKISKTREKKKLKTGEIKEYTRVRGYIDLPEHYEDRELYVVPKEFIETLNNLLSDYYPTFSINLKNLPRVRELIKKLKEYDPKHYDVCFAESIVGSEDEDVKKIEESIEGLEDDIMGFLESLGFMIEKTTGLEPIDFRYDWVNRLEVVTDQDISLYIELYPKENKVKVEITRIKH